MKKIIPTLFVLQSFFAFIFNVNAEGININDSCEIVSKDIFKNSEKYISQLKSINNNPYQYFLFLKTDSKNVNTECIVLVNLELKLTEYMDKDKKQNFVETRSCGENTSLAGKPEYLRAYLHQFVRQKIDTCLLN
jgi:hypothetical protein